MFPFIYTQRSFNYIYKPHFYMMRQKCIDCKEKFAKDNSYCLSCMKNHDIESYKKHTTRKLCKELFCIENTKYNNIYCDKHFPKIFEAQLRSDIMEDENFTYYIMVEPLIKCHRILSEERYDRSDIEYAYNNGLKCIIWSMNTDISGSDLDQII